MHKKITKTLDITCKMSYIYQCDTGFKISIKKLHFNVRKRRTMRRKSEKALAVVLASVVAASTLAGCGGGNNAASSASNAGEKTSTASTGSSKTSESASSEKTSSTTSETPSGETKVIRYGTHWVAGLDPNNIDEVTGEYTMAENERQAGLAALDAVKKELNVEFKFVQYAADTRTELMTSVLAGDPVCDIATIWGGAEGTILAQNVLQPIDDYADIFADESVNWMFNGKLYGHNYLLSNTERFYQRWPLIYNATLIDAVDTLKDKDGNTIYPTDLFLKGEWTWSKFEDYLSKLNAYYSNVASADGCVYDKVQAYETDHRFAGLSAIYSNGGAIYGDNGLAVNSDETKKGLEFIAKLFKEKYLTDCGTYDDGYTPQWTTAQGDFSRSGTVFTDCPDWLIGSATSAVAERNESVGMVPWPRPDDLDKDSEKYQQVITLGDSVGVLKGVDAETTKLALEAFKLYWETYYKTLGGVDDLKDYKSAMAASQASAAGFDIYNEKYGQDILDCFIWNSEHLSNDYADLLGLRVSWDDVLGKSLYGLEGMADYTVAIEENKNLFDNVIKQMEATLASDEVKDNMAPETTSSDIVVTLGTDLSKEDFKQYFTAKDSVDGELDLAKAEFNVSDSVDTSKAGVYDGGVEMKIKDSSDNEASAKAKVIVYNPDNKKAPKVEVKETTDPVKLDTDASTIDWKNYVESAVDADGIDVKGKIEADLSTLDTTTPGEYDVALTVTDYAGNTATATVKVTVAEAE